MKKTGIFSILALIIVIAGWYFFIQPFNLAKFDLQHAHNYTVTAKTNIEKAEKIKGAIPDSGIYYYNQAIKLLAAKTDVQSLRTVGESYIGIAAINYYIGNSTESSKYDSLAMNIATQIGDKNIEAQAINIKGLLFYNSGDYDSAIEYYKQAQKLAQIVGNKKIVAKIYTNLAVIDYLRGNKKEVVQNFEKSFEIAKQLNNNELLSGGYNNLALMHYYWGNYAQSVEYYHKALEIYRQINGKDGILLCYQNIGNVYFNTGDYTKAIETWNKSLALSVEIGDKPNTARAHQNLGEVYARLGDYETAVNHYISGIKIKEEINDSKGLAFSFTSLGLLHYLRNNFAKALEYYQKVLEINQKLNYADGLAVAYTNIGQVYGAEQKNDSAIELYQKALEIYQKAENKANIADIYSRLAVVFRTKKEFTEAEKYFFNSLKLKTELFDKPSIALLYCDLAQMYFDKAGAETGNLTVNYNKAVHYGLLAYQLADSLNEMPTVNFASMVLKNSYKQLGNTAKALLYAEKYISTHDSLFNKSKNEAVTFAEARWNAEKKQREIEHLQNEKKLHNEIISRQKTENWHQKIIIYAIGALFFMIIMSASAIIYSVKKHRDALLQKQFANIATLKMQNIRNQMSPHFFFNALSNISGAVYQPEMMRKKLGILTLLLRKTLENIEKTVIPLQEEIKVVKAFVELGYPRNVGQNYYFCSKIKGKK